MGWSSVTLTRLHGEQWHWRFLLLFRLVRFEVSSGHVNQLEREARRRSTKSGTRHARLRVSIIKHNASGGIFFGPTPRRSAIQGFSGYVRAIVKQRPCFMKCLYHEFFSTRARDLGHKILWRNNSARTRFREKNSTCRSITRKKLAIVNLLSSTRSPISLRHVFCHRGLLHN